VARGKAWKAARDKRDGRTFVALPTVVIESPGFRAASYTARALLIDIAAQYSGHNNGKLTACRKYLSARGWNSNDVIVRARRELIDCGLILETRKGARPNRAAWYALTWVAIDAIDGMDIDPKLHRTGGYMHPEAKVMNGTTLGPAGGVVVGRIGPGGGPGTAAAGPSGGAMPAPSGDCLGRQAVRI
jgi:hypothetical protein